MNKFLVSIFVFGVVAFGQNDNTAAFPGALATDFTTLVASDNAISVLAAAINSTATTFSLTTPANFVAPTALTFENGEKVMCPTLSGSTYSGCTRGFQGSIAQAQPQGALVYENILSYFPNQSNAEIKVVEAALGTNFHGGGLTSQSANYSFQATDYGTLVVFNGSSLTGLLASPPPTAMWKIAVLNLNSSALTISRNGLLINGQASNVTLAQYQSTVIWTDGTNYFSASGGLVTNGNNGQYLTSNGAGGFGLAVSLGSISLFPEGISGSSVGLNNTNNIYSGQVQFTGTTDSSAATHTRVTGVSTTTAGLPGTCSVGELWFVSGATAGQNLYECGSVNTWTQQLNNAGGSGGFGSAACGTPSVSGGAVAPTFSSTVNCAAFTITVNTTVTPSGMTGSGPYYYVVTNSAPTASPLTYAGVAVSGVCQPDASSAGAITIIEMTLISSTLYPVSCPSATAAGPTAGSILASNYPTGPAKAATAANIYGVFGCSGDVNTYPNGSGTCTGVPYAALTSTGFGTGVLGALARSVNGTSGNICLSDGTSPCNNGSGGTGTISSQGKTSVINMTGSPVTIYSVSSVPALAAGACYELKFTIFSNTAMQVQTYVDSTVIMDTGSAAVGSSANPYWVEDQMICNNAGSQTSQVDSRVGAFYAAATAGANLVGYLPGSGINLATATNWATTHTISVQVTAVNTATATGYNFKLTQ